MFNKRIILLFLLVFSCPIAVMAMQPAPKQGNRSEEPLIEKGDRILILAPHPDDEAIACAGIIQDAVSKGAQVRIAYLTNGDHNQFSFIVYEKRLPFLKGEFIHMGEVRMNEARKAMKLLGLDESNLIFLGYPDFGTFAILRGYWGNSRPYKNMLTHISSVPYKTNLSFNAPYVGDSILNDLKNVLITYNPDKIFVSHPADVNVDHKSLYLFLQVALADLENQIPHPKVYPYLVHCLGWPSPRHYHPELGLEPPQKFINEQINWRKFGLTDKQLEMKRQAILSYRSQTESSAFYLLSFARKNELFGDYSNDKNTGQIQYSVDNGYFIIRINKPREAVKYISTLTYLFGYSYKKPFAAMPKIFMISNHNEVKLFDGSKKVRAEEAKVNLSGETLTLSVPLKVLGEPDFLFVSVKVSEVSSPIYFSGFRKIIVRGRDNGGTKVNQDK